MNNKLPYDLEDFRMTKEELVAKYGDNGHPRYTTVDWLLLKESDSGISTYWDWVISSIAADAKASIKDVSLNSSDLIPVTDLDQFVSVLMDWHQNKVARLEYLLTIPDGTETTLNETESVVLTGDVRTAFIIGITVALTELGKLPFVTEAEPTTETPANA